MIFASGLKYVGLGTTALGWMLGAMLLAAAVYWLAYLRPRQAGLRIEAASEPVGVDTAPTSTLEPSA